MPHSTLPFGLSTAYQNIVLDYLRLVNCAHAAIAYLNLGEAEKAQDALLGLIADLERSR